MTLIRTPAVAGQFYPANPAELNATVATLLDEAQARETPAPKALIVPHAGYIYSGPIAATAYERLRRNRDQYQRVVLLGPCHRVPVKGIALSSADFYRTPLGDVRIDRSAVEDLHMPDVTVFDESHREEHSLEVHLPFLQVVLGEFSLVPVVVGDVAPGRVCELLDALWGGPETLIVVSSDLSHYRKYDEARSMDATTCRRIESVDAGHISHEMACGATPVAGLLLAARQHDLSVYTLDVKNSGDTMGGRDFVVGYGAWVFA